LLPFNDMLRSRRSEDTPLWNRSHVTYYLMNSDKNMLWTFSANCIVHGKQSSLILNYSTSIDLQATFLLDKQKKSWHSHRVNHMWAVMVFLLCHEISKGEQIRDLGMGIYCHIQWYFSYIIAVNFIVGRKQSTRRKTPDQRQVTYKLKNCVPWLIRYSSLFYIDVITGAVVIVRCNQCLSPLKVWVQTHFMARCTRYNIMW
jgi:hypothetical protein